MKAPHNLSLVLDVGSARKPGYTEDAARLRLLKNTPSGGTVPWRVVQRIFCRTPLTSSRGMLDLSVFFLSRWTSQPTSCRAD